ncbi:MAG: hypothetical protein QM645_09920 [Asticcacaulis sp.]
MSSGPAAKLAKSVLACAVGAAVPLLAMLFDQSLHDPDLGISAKKMIIASNLFLGFGIFTALCLFGLPVQYVMQQNRITHILWHVLPAAVAGGVLLSWVFGFEPRSFLNGVLSGAISAAIAWLVRRPDKDVV